MQRGEIVAFVGAGGKSTAMRRLAGELADEGWRVIATTTTKIGLAQGKAYDALLVRGDADRLAAETAAALQRVACVAVARAHLPAEDKLAGLPPNWVPRLADLADALLVEADGARGRSFKAPADYEPVIPEAATCVVAVAGLDALGQRLDSPLVHRPERVAALVQDSWITADTVARALGHPQGGLKGVPKGARFVALLNKAETPSLLQAGREIAQALLEAPRVEAVLLGAVAGEDPVSERWERTAAVVLAAGGSARFGSPKQLLPFGEGTLLGRVLDSVLAAPLEPVVLVLGAQAEAIAAALPPETLRRVRLVHNPRWEEGLSSSLRAGLAALRETVGAALLVLGDQPNVTAELIHQLLMQRARRGARIVAPVCRGRRGNPVLFDRTLFAELADVTGDQGGREVIARHIAELDTVEVADPEALADIDTCADYQRLQTQ